jgi:hypothetical protein
MADDVHRNDYCGTAEQVPHGTGYRCSACGVWWRYEDDEDDEDDEEDTDG